MTHYARFLLAAAALVASPLFAVAAQDTWSGASGATWDTTTANWNGAMFTNGDDAVFSNATGNNSITLGASVTAGNIWSNGANTPGTLTINGATGDTLTLGTGTAGTGNIGALTGGAGYAGNLTIKTTVAGEALLSIAAGSGTSSTPISWNMAGGTTNTNKTLLINGSTGAETVQLNGNFITVSESGTIGTNSTVKIQGVTLTGGNFTVSSGILEFSGGSGQPLTADSSNSVVVNSGASLMMDFNSSTGSAISVSTTLNSGGTIGQRSGGIGVTTTDSGTITVNGAAKVSNAANANFILSGVITDGTSAGSLTFTATGGSTTLSGNNTYSGGTTISTGTLVIAASTGAIKVGNAGVSVASGATLAVNGTLNLTGATATITNSGTIAFAASGASIAAGNLFDGITGNTYQLISGSGTITNGTSVGIILTGSSMWSSATLNNAGLITFTVVPEPSAYGLIGAGALAGIALVRRRRKVAGIAA